MRQSRQKSMQRGTPPSLGNLYGSCFILAWYMHLPYTLCRGPRGGHVEPFCRFCSTLLRLEGLNSSFHTYFSPTDRSAYFFGTASVSRRETNAAFRAHRQPNGESLS
jgi:hypothetical protein